MDLGALKINFPFRPSDAMPAKQNYEYKPSAWDRFISEGPAAWVEQKMLGVGDAAQAPINAAKAAAGEVVTATSAGIKYGLILFAALLALFVIAQFKTITR